MTFSILLLLTNSSFLKPIPFPGTKEAIVIKDFPVKLKQFHKMVIADLPRPTLVKSFFLPKISWQNLFKILTEQRKHCGCVGQKKNCWW